MNHRFTTQVSPDPSAVIIAVDLGYSAKRKTCGLKWSVDEPANQYCFGECIHKTVDLIERARASSIVLVLEAVLSTFHDPGNGNPGLRGEFERGRGWYCGPGVVTFAAAIRFLQQVHRNLTVDREIALAEAFLSNKAERTGHHQDADRIFERFWSAEAVPLNEAAVPILPIIDGVPSVRVF